MYTRKLCLPSVALVASVLAANTAWAIGFELGETKDQLKLDYEVSIVDHGTGRVTVNLTIADEGRLKPLRSVDLLIPMKEGSGHVDLSVSLATRNVDGKLVASAHLLKEWAERAAIQLKTSGLDGKPTPLTWYYHSIPLAEYLKQAVPQKN